MAHLEIEGLVVRYGPLVALDGLNLSIGAGEMFVLLGGSGSGKTTLLRCLGGFIQPGAGRIVLGGEDVTRLPPHKRPVNTTFQSYALFPHMSVADNVAFGLRRQSVGKAEIAERVGALLRLVRLEAFADRRPEALSGGQRQRVALARALAPRPKLLLLDEPMSALDRGLREQTRQELLRVQRETGTTFVLVTHDQDEALAMATRIGLLNEGRLAQVGTPAEIYERPVSRFVAGFMGGANVLTGQAVEGGVEVPGVGTVRVPGGGALGHEVHVAVRPERVRLGGAGVNRVAGTVTEVAYRGDVAEVSVLFGTGGVFHVLQPLSEGAAAGVPQRGAAVEVTWAAEACVVLRE